MTQEKCAAACCADGFSGESILIGVEYGAQCYCGKAYGS